MEKFDVRDRDGTRSMEHAAHEHAHGGVPHAEKAAILIVSRLDRLGRDASWLLGLEKRGIDFVVASSPHVNRLSVWPKRNRRITNGCITAAPRIPLCLENFCGFHQTRYANTQQIQRSVSGQTLRQSNFRTRQEAGEKGVVPASSLEFTSQGGF